MILAQMRRSNQKCDGTQSANHALVSSVLDEIWGRWSLSASQEGSFEVYWRRADIPLVGQQVVSRVQGQQRPHPCGL
jgi:hypothetical protein